MRWHYRDPLLVWLFPAFYVCHLVEEWLGRFPEWVARLAGRPMPIAAFLVINAAALIVLIAGTRATIRREEHGWIGIAIATVAFTNAVLHLLGTLLAGAYSPGLFTGIVLYVPLGLLALLRAWSQADAGAFSRGVGAGLAIHAAVIALALASVYFAA